MITGPLINEVIVKRQKNWHRNLHSPVSRTRWADASVVVAIAVTVTMIVIVRVTIENALTVVLARIGIAWGLQFVAVLSAEKGQEMELDGI